MRTTKSWLYNWNKARQLKGIKVLRLHLCPYLGYFCISSNSLVKLADWGCFTRFLIVFWIKKQYLIVKQLILFQSGCKFYICTYNNSNLTLVTSWPSICSQMCRLFLSCGILGQERDLSSRVESFDITLATSKVPIRWFNGFGDSQGLGIWNVYRRTQFNITVRNILLWNERLTYHIIIPKLA